MKPKHTQGPWAGPFSRESYAGHALVVIEGDPGKHVSFAIYPQAKLESEVQANARLIAAAPELLTNLRNLVYQLEYHIKNNNDFGADQQRVLEAKAIIDKVEGR